MKAVSILLLTLIAVLVAGSKLCFPIDGVGHREQPIVVIIPSYNNGNYVYENLASVLKQRYSNYRVIYIDDCSTDSTYANAMAIVKQFNMQDRVKVIHNSRRRGAMANWFNAIHSCNDEEIIVHLDGDDKLANDNVLLKINSVYQKGEIWFTYGSYELSTTHKIGCAPYSKETIRNNAFRKSVLVMSHLRTHKAWLFKSIPLEEFLFDDQFFPVACDCAMMYPFIEMSSKGHFAYISEPLYIYNVSPSSDGIIQPQKQVAAEQFIRNKLPYKPLNQPMFVTRDNIEDSIALLIIVKNLTSDFPERLNSFASNLNAVKEICVLYSEHISMQEFETLYDRFPTIKWNFLQIPVNLIVTMKEVIEFLSCNYILLSVNDYKLNSELNLDVCISMLKKTWTSVFYLSQSAMDCSNFRGQLPLIDIDNNVYALYSSNTNINWNQAKPSLNLFAKDFLYNVLNEIDNQIDFNQAFCSYFADHRVLGLCFEASI